MPTAFKQDRAALLTGAVTLLRPICPTITVSTLEDAILGSSGAGAGRSIKNLRVKEFCDRCEVSRPTVFRWIKDGKIKVFRIGGVLRIPETELSQHTKANGGGVR